MRHCSCQRKLEAFACIRAAGNSWQIGSIKPQGLGFSPPRLFLARTFSCGFLAVLVPSWPGLGSIREWIRLRFEAFGGHFGSLKVSGLPLWNFFDTIIFGKILGLVIHAKCSELLFPTGRRHQAVRLFQYSYSEDSKHLRFSACSYSDHSEYSEYSKDHNMQHVQNIQNT